MKVEHENRLMRLIESFGHSQLTIGQCNMINGDAPAFDELRKMAKANAEHTIDQIHEILREDQAVEHAEEMWAKMDKAMKAQKAAMQD